MDFYTADNHFRHKNIQIYCPDRPGPGIEKHDKEQTDGWNSVVTSVDRVTVCGDFAFADIDVIAAILKKLNGEKHLIVGNHDKHPWADYIRAGFASVQRYKILNIPGVGPVGLAHDPATCILDSNIPWLVGHLHQQFLRMGNAINVGVDVRGFTPVSLVELEKDFMIAKLHIKGDKNAVAMAKKEILGIE